jgi:hypothetical protein
MPQTQTGAAKFATFDKVKRGLSSMPALRDSHIQDQVHVQRIALARVPICGVASLKRREGDEQKGLVTYPGSKFAIIGNTIMCTAFKRTTWDMFKTAFLDLDG